MNSAAMEQRSKYMHWGMWGARSSSSTATPIPWAAAASYGGEPSWEEQAFARDAAANLGGCVWPPRSYSCSFCQREFRSAQALGGHMNVHRRDRARLRQCSSPDDVQLEAPHDHQPHQDTFLYRAISNPSTTTRPSVPAKGDVTSSSTTSYLSAIIKESKNKVLMSMPMSRPVREEATDQYDHDDEEESGRAKRRCVDHPSVALPIFVRPVAAAAPAAPCEGKGLQGVVDHDHDAEVHKTTASPSSISPLVDRQVDLELRLGTTQS